VGELGLLGNSASEKFWNSAPATPWLAEAGRTLNVAAQ
jgi:hypothetical protein